MPTRFNDDDYEDYANGDYSDEDYSEEEIQTGEELTQEEEEARMYELAPLVTAQLKEYEGFTEDDVLQALYENYNALDATVAQMKRAFKKKQVVKPKLVLKTNTESKGLSKLAMLAKARAQKKSEQEETPITEKLNGLRGGNTSISILDNLKIGNIKNKERLESTNSNKTLTKLKQLAALKAQKSVVNETPQMPHSTTKTNSPKQIETTVPSDTKPVEKKQALSDLNLFLEISPLLSYTNPSSTTTVSFLNATPNSISSLFTTQPNTEMRKRKLKELNLNTVNFPNTNDPLAKKIKINFTKSSPDDIALEAQSQAIGKQIKEENQMIEAVSALKIGATTTTKTATKPKHKTDIQSELNKRKTKPNISFVIIGHVDAGKSTLTGRLLLDQNVVDKNTYTKLKREAEKQGKGSFSLAWVMDQSPEERNRGVTIDICSTQIITERAQLTIVDSPGHKDFIPNMITGVSQSDVAVLVVDSSTDAFEAGFNLDGQTKEHTILARSLGIERLVVAVNKMDNVDWSEVRFEEIKGQLMEFLKMVGFKADNVQFVPCSGLSGMNVSSRPTTEQRLLNWYKGGECLLEVLEKCDKFDKDVDLPFVLSITDINQASSEFSGRVETGMIQVGETVSLSPSGQFGVVDSIKLNESEKSNVAIAGDNAVIKVKNITIEEVQPGDLMTIVNHEIPVGDKFESKLVLFDLKKPVLVGMEFVLFRGNTQQPAKISKIVSLFDKVTGEASTKKRLKHLSSKQTAIVEIELIGRKIPLQLFKENKHLGRFVLRKDGDTIGAGVVEKF